MLIISNCWQIDNQFVIFEEDENEDENENENEDDYNWSAILMISSDIKYEFWTIMRKVFVPMIEGTWWKDLFEMIWIELLEKSFIEIIYANHFCISSGRCYTKWCISRGLEIFHL
jgi:hypothetical protein